MTLGSSLRRRLGFAAPRRSPGPRRLSAEAAARSHVGKVRDINEDRFLVRSERGLWAVADGMGGHSAGGEAAEAAMRELAVLADCAEPIDAAGIRAALAGANRLIRAGAQGRGSVSGTTVVVAWLADERLTVFWAGDSRAYLLRGHEARCVTRDHSVVQEMLDAGEITESEEAARRYGHLVTRALGAADALDIDEVAVGLRAGDRVLLCSDGVSRSLDAAGTARRRGSLEQFAEDVLGAALHRDGSDNATLVAIQLNG